MARTKIVFDCSTGIQTEVELTAEEIAAADEAAAAKEIAAAAREAEQAERAASRSSGEAKLADLGLSADEIAALVG